MEWIIVKKRYKTLTPYLSSCMDPLDNDIIFSFWTGANSMSAARRRCLETLRNSTDCRIELITVDNLDEYVLKDHPLHEGYPYLSAVHKADYLRTYFMHFYGGGYSDIKLPSGSWSAAFEQMRADDSIVLNGYHEDGPWDIGNEHVRHLWSLLPGNCAYIVRPGTQFTRDWYEGMIKIMDSKLVELRLHPAPHPRACKREGSGYPIVWDEILGRHFHQVASNYVESLLFTVPKPILIYTLYA